jgi:hypothetical protein
MNTQVFIIMLFVLGSVLAFPQAIASLHIDDKSQVKSFYRRGECIAGVCITKREETNGIQPNQDHKLIQIRKGRDSGKSVVVQTKGTLSCPLIAIFNIMALRGDITIDPILTPTISEDFMVNALRDYLDDKALGLRTSDGSGDDLLRKAKEFLPSLKTGLAGDEDVTDPTVFTDFVPEINLLKGLSCCSYTLQTESFDIPFIHITVADPEMRNYAEIIQYGTSINQINQIRSKNNLTWLEMRVKAEKFYKFRQGSPPTIYGLEQATMMMKRETYSILNSEGHAVSSNYLT